MYIVQLSLVSEQFSLDNLHCSIYFGQCSLYTVKVELYSVQFNFDSVHFTFDSVQWSWSADSKQRIQWSEHTSHLSFYNEIRQYKIWNTCSFVVSLHQKGIIYSFCRRVHAFLVACPVFFLSVQIKLLGPSSFVMTYSKMPS